MPALREASFTANLHELLAETFEGPPPGKWSVYLDDGGGLLQILDDVDAAPASRAPKPGAPSIAAHAAHARYFVEILRSHLRKAPVRADWPGSWSTAAVDATQWTALRGLLRASYEAAAAEMRAVDAWDEDSVGAAMAILVHTAYHLAAIRTIRRLG